MIVQNFIIDILDYLFSLIILDKKWHANNYFIITIDHNLREY